MSENSLLMRLDLITKFTKGIATDEWNIRSDASFIGVETISIDMFHDVNYSIHPVQ